MMKLSILDQSPISTGKTAKDALMASTDLARTADKLGFTRYWIAEHHGMDGLASPNPSVMISYIGAHTEQIRLGSGAVLLPHYQPYFIAETYHLLSTLFPNRIDLGIGRAPGGSAEAAIALAGNFLENVKGFPDALDELNHFLYGTFSADHMYHKVALTAQSHTPPQPWLLGTSERSGMLAAKKGMPYVFGHFMSQSDGPAIVEKYKQQFVPNDPASKSKAIAAVSVICADTTKKAEEMAWSSYLWKVKQDKVHSDNKVPSVQEAKQYAYEKDDLKAIEDMKKKMIIGSPSEVKEQLMDLKRLYGVEEIMIVTITHEYEDRLRSYELIAKEIFEG